MISGNPVRSDTSRTVIPPAASSRAVPPVETISTPRSASPRANSRIPVLSETDRSALPTRTSPGATGAYRATDWMPCSISPTLPIDHDTARVCLIEAHRAASKEAHRLRQQLVLDRTQMDEHVGRVASPRKLNRALEDHRTAVDALID